MGPIFDLSGKEPYMSPPRSARHLLVPIPRMINTFRFPFNPMKYPASNTTLSRGTAVSRPPSAG